MGIIGGALGYHLLRFCFPQHHPAAKNSSCGDDHKSLASRFGPSIWSQFENKTVIDFGCGYGEDAMAIARHARRVIGIDIQEEALRSARKQAQQEGLQNVEFATGTREKADLIISINSFEHFADPAGVLDTMADLLGPGGEVLISFGPPWYHPRGGHLFSVFPWAHLLFTEKALIR